MLCPAIVLLGLLSHTGPAAGASAAPQPGLSVEDIFGRPLNDARVVLVDWEGYIANPAVRFFVRPPSDAAFPATATLTANDARLCFDLPSVAGAEGPRKELAFPRDQKLPVLVSIFPDRAAHDQDRVLEIRFRDARGRTERLAVPIHVIDQDRDRPNKFHVVVDFSQDKTGFFRVAKRREIVEQAASDWAYFLDGTRWEPVAAGTEKTFIWDQDGFKTGRQVSNARAYTGYLLYGYGIHSAEVRSGGEPSRYGGFQRDAATGTVLPIRRSGGIEVETAGNYNSRGWLVELDDAQWWKATNLGDVPNDLYSIVHHEIGHALFFNPAHPRIDEAKRGNGLAAPDLRAYLGRNPRIDRADHFDGAIDPVCRRGAFGYEYHGQMPLGRWLITKLDLLAAQAAGYRLRDTAPFVPLAMSGAALPPANRAAWYSAMLRASGGVPFYNWEVIAGALPPGLSLDSFTGEMRGRPTQSGSYDFTVRVRDYDENAAGQTRRLRIVVADSAAPSPADPHHETAPLPHYRRHVPTTDGEHHEPG